MFMENAVEILVANELPSSSKEASLFTAVAIYLFSNF